MSVNRSGRMNLFSLMQSISEMDDINKEQVINSFSSVAATHRIIAGTCAGSYMTSRCKAFFILMLLLF